MISFHSSPAFPSPCNLADCVPSTASFVARTRAAVRLEFVACVRLSLVCPIDIGARGGLGGLAADARSQWLVGRRVGPDFSGIRPDESEARADSLEWKERRCGHARPCMHAETGSPALFSSLHTSSSPLRSRPDSTSSWRPPPCEFTRTRAPVAKWARHRRRQQQAHPPPSPPAGLLPRVVRRCTRRRRRPSGRACCTCTSSRRDT